MTEMTRINLLPLLEEARRERDQGQADMIRLADAQKRYNDFSLTVQGLEAWIDRIQDGKAKGAELAAAAEAVTQMNGHLATDTYVRPKDAIMRLVSEQPRDWSLSEIEAAMRERKWLDLSLARPTEAIRAAANRLVDVEQQ